METREYRTIDKSGWGDGPWQSEPDKRQWQDVVTGLPCLIVRSRHGGNLCGYVGVAKSHPSHGLHYDEIERAVDDIDVHGGLTFSGACGHGADESIGICHVPGDGEPDDVWWFGFDCAHAWDMSPGYASRFQAFSIGDETYRTVGYVESECRRLAVQLASVTSV